MRSLADVLQRDQHWDQKRWVRPFCALLYAGNPRARRQEFGVRMRIRSGDAGSQGGGKDATRSGFRR